MTVELNYQVTQASLAEFSAALRGKPNELDHWLEENSEDSVRAHIVTLCKLGGLWTQMNGANGDDVR
jgi:hypothetical protein